MINFIILFHFARPSFFWYDNESGHYDPFSLDTTQVELEYHMNHYLSSAQVVDHIRQLQHVGGNTNTASALKWSNDYMKSMK